MFVDCTPSAGSCEEILTFHRDEPAELLRRRRHRRRSQTPLRPWLVRVLVRRALCSIVI